MLSLGIKLSTWKAITVTPATQEKARVFWVLTAKSLLHV